MEIRWDVEPCSTGAVEPWSDGVWADWPDRDRPFRVGSQQLAVYAALQAGPLLYLSATSGMDEPVSIVWAGTGLWCTVERWCHTQWLDALADDARLELRHVADREPAMVGPGASVDVATAVRRAAQVASMGIQAPALPGVHWVELPS